MGGGAVLLQSNDLKDCLGCINPGSKNKITQSFFV
uniref:Uncharacterized protein n=1 Tax=Anguilla anguilla TaxID=7936 RepID=A0A0E9TYH3_ANGAN